MEEKGQTVLTVFDDTIANVISNNKTSPIFQ